MRTSEQSPTPVAESAIDIGQFLSQLNAEKDSLQLAHIAIPDTEVETSTEATSWQSKHLAQVEAQLKKLEQLPQIFETVVSGIAGTLSVLPNFLQAAAALCPHCIVPVAQVASGLGSFASGSGGLGGLGGLGLPGSGHFHSDGRWHADEKKLATSKTAPSKLKGRSKQTVGRSTEAKNVWGRGLNMVSFGLIELFTQSLIPDPQVS